MNRSVELPIVEPIYGTYHNQGSGGAVISENPSIRNWYLANALILNCNTKFLYDAYSPNVSVKNSYSMCNPHIEITKFSTFEMGSEIHTLIRALLDSGCYVYFSLVDDYYVQGKSMYKKRHFCHDGLLCGYDLDEKTYSIFAYDENWVYRVFKTPVRCFSQGRRSFARYNLYGELHAYRPKEDHVEFDPKKVCEHIKEYLDSDYKQYPIDKEYTVYGNISHDYLALYIDAIATEKIPHEMMDWRVMRMVWEQKKAMNEAVSKLEDNLGLDKKISTGYAKEVTGEINRARMLYASHHMKRRIPLLATVRGILMDTKMKEFELLLKICEKAEEVIGS